MIPVSSNTESNKDGCSPISSNCVVWQGPDIPCINLCAGDNVTDVVYKLGTQLCQITNNLFDITEIDASCLLEPGQTTPATQEALMQLMIDKICVALDCCGTGGGSPSNPYYDLPECLWYEDGDGNTVTQLHVDAYLEYLATKICDIITQINTINATLENHEIRITALETATPPAPPTITVTTQCASGPTPGVILPITTAFQNLESTFCDFIGYLGSDGEITSFVNYECAGLDDAPQLSDPTQVMSDLPGWTVTPTNMSQALMNMWLTICDIRTKVSTCCADTELPCILMPVTNITTADVTTTSATINWYLPATSGVSQPPVSYVINIYEWNGVAAVGGSLYSDTVLHPSNTLTLPNGTMVAGQAYQIVITALYNCGSVNATSIAYLVADVPTMCILVTDEARAGDVTTSCNSTSYVSALRRTTATIIDWSTGLPITNSTTSNLSIELHYWLDDGCGTAYDTAQTVLIPPGSSSVYYDYTHSEKVLCETICVDSTITYVGVDIAHSIVDPYTFCSSTLSFVAP